MIGATTFKSHVLRRDEKGFFGIPFKRLLGAGLGGGMMMTVTKLPLGDWSLLCGLVSAVSILVLIAPRGGIPRWQQIFYSWRWQLLTAATTAPHSLLGSLATAFDLHHGSIYVDGTALFSRGDALAPRTELTDWVSFSNPAHIEPESGMVFVKRPLLRQELAA
jgi:hypothetical protein